MKSDAEPTRHMPTEIRLKSAEKILEVDIEDGFKAALPAELLRVESPSAEVQGHGSGQKKTLPGRRHIGIMNVEPVGNYAIKISFDDMHDTGIFSWNYLYELARDHETIWQDYLDRLEAQGLSRDP
jgi:DUF971 family protein